MRLYYEITIFFAHIPWILYLVRKITMNSISISRIYSEFFFHFANWRWIYLLFCNFTLNSLPVSLDQIFKIKNVNSHFLRAITRLYCIYILPSYNECTFCFAIPQWIHSSLVNSPRIGYLLLEFTTNSRFFRKMNINRLFNFPSDACGFIWISPSRKYIAYFSDLNSCLAERNAKLTSFRPNTVKLAKLNNLLYKFGIV